jgi:hypothetical protein
VWDYIGFAVCFAGLGYIGLALPPVLHAFGGGAAAFVPLRLIIAVANRRRAAGGDSMPAAHTGKPAARSRPLRRKAHYPVRQVKPRSHFGLRGVPE